MTKRSPRLVAEVVQALVGGIRLLLSNWRLCVLELVPALWLAAVVNAARSDLIRWEQETLIAAPHYWAEGFTVADGSQVVAFASVGAFVYLCNTVFAFAAADPDGPNVRRAWRVMAARPGPLRKAMAWGALAGLLRIVALLVPLPDDRWSVLARLLAVLALQLVLFVDVPARIVGYDRHLLDRRQRLALSTLTTALSFVVVLLVFGVGRLAVWAFSVDKLAVLGVALSLVALLVQISGIVVVRTVGMGARLLARDSG